MMHGHRLQTLLMFLVSCKEPLSFPCYFFSLSVWPKGAIHIKKLKINFSMVCLISWHVRDIKDSFSLSLEPFVCNTLKSAVVLKESGTELTDKVSSVIFLIALNMKYYLKEWNQIISKTVFCSVWCIFIRLPPKSHSVTGNCIWNFAHRIIFS